MIDFLKGTVGKDYFSDRLYGCQECIAEYLASKEPSRPKVHSSLSAFSMQRLSSFAREEGIKLKEALITLRTKAGIVGILQPSIPWDLFTFIKTTYDISLDFRIYFSKQPPNQPF